MNENIQKEYKKTNDIQEKKLIENDKKIAIKLSIDDRVDIPGKSEAYITLKDHKQNFETKPSCRLINPNKTEIGKISKCILQKINKQIKSKSKLNQWISTQEVLKWFNGVKNKSKCSSCNWSF